jgi:dimeric dUTPase (all-alpha-NTP-PPase superfamily)
MQLTKLYEMQQELDDRIVKEHPPGKGEDRLAKKILALQVELGECANEWRGFKYWSKNQLPQKNIHTTEGATTDNAIFYQCGDDDCGERFNKGDARLSDLFGENEEDCPVCKEGYLYSFREKNPLLEEYVDCLHFILSIGLEIGVDYFKYVPIQKYKEVDISRQFMNVMSYTLGLLEDDYCSELLSSFVFLGEMLGFTWEQIEQAYIRKNEINHIRQESGY